MMGIKQKLKSGLEYDVIYGKKKYCYLVNNNKLVRFAQKAMRKRRRAESKNHMQKVIMEV